MTIATTPVASRLIHTFELLEQILLSLQDPEEAYQDRGQSLRTIMLTRRVSRTFRDTILNSTPLQKILFFHVPKRNGGTSYPMVNDILCVDPLPSIEVYPNYRKGTRWVLHVEFRSWGERGEVLKGGGGMGGVQSSWREMYLSSSGYEVYAVLVTEKKRLSGEQVVVEMINPSLGELVDAVCAKSVKMGRDV